VQDYFLVIVSEFVYIPWKHSQEQAIQRAEALAAGSNFCTPSVTVSAASDIEAQETAYLKHQVKLPTISLTSAHRQLMQSLSKFIVNCTNSLTAYSEPPNRKVHQAPNETMT
jgi:hypothetical protein